MLQTRSSGLLLPVFSLPGPYGIGDIGPAAEAWIDRLAEAGQRYWQVLPLHPVHRQLYYSPYSGLSAFAGSLLLLSPDRLLADGWLDELPPFAGESEGNLTDYAAAEAYKAQLVDTAFEKFKTSGQQAESFRRFCEEERPWLDGYAAFEVAVARQAELDWTRWSKSWRSGPDVLERLSEEAPDELQRVRFGQYLFFEQWDALHAYARRRGIHLIGDIPIYVHQYSADVWMYPELFQLRKNGKPRKVAGVPPDYFSKDGQLWGNPVYDWKAHRGQGFGWWIERLRHELRCFDLVRIDHFLGLVQYWEVDAGEKTARTGEYRKVPKEAFFGALQRHFPDLPFIAEDLGSVTEEAILTMQRYHLPGMKVLHFAFGGDSGNPYLPHNYPHNCIAYTGTHDNNTSRGWWRKDTKKPLRRHVEQYAGQPITEENVAEVLRRLVWQSPAHLAISSYQDLLNLDETGRLNQPGTVKQNWQWRMMAGQLEGEQWTALRELTELYGRG